MPDEPRRSDLETEIYQESLLALRKLPQEVLALKGTVNALEQDLEDAREDRRELRSELQAMTTSRRTFVIALLGVGGTITAALIAAAVSLVIHFS